MATTRFVLTPESAHFPATGYANLASQATTLRPCLDFDAGATEEEAWWTFVAPQGLTGALSAVISYTMASATSGTCAWNVYLESLADADATGSTSWGTTNDGSVTVPGTAGLLDQISITLTNDDGIAAGELVRVRLVRDTSVDTATGDARVFSVEIREA